MSALYPSFKESALSHSPSIDMDTDTIKVALVNKGTDYTYLPTHDFLDNVVTYAGSTAQTLGSITVTGGVFDAANSTFTAVAADSGKAVDALVIYKDTGVANTSPLVAFIDGFTGVVPNGGDITITWDTSIFSM